MNQLLSEASADSHICQNNERSTTVQAPHLCDTCVTHDNMDGKVAGLALLFLNAACTILNISPYPGKDSDGYHFC